MELSLRSNNMRLHLVVFRLWSVGLWLMCMQRCLGLDLHSQDPELTEVPDGLPTDITVLILRVNEISEIGADNFTGLSSVVEIDLHFNRIRHIDGNAFLPCIALSVLKLGHNELTSLPHTLGLNSPYMSYLTVDENPVVIEDSWFRQFRSPQKLNIDNIGMREFPDDFFTGLISLTHLDISHVKAPNLTERTVSLQELSFHYHIGSIFPDENCLNLRNLTTVYMRHGDLMTTLPQFLGATALKTFQCQHFDAESIPDLSHLISLDSFMFPYAKLICDHRLCWTLFETFSFSLWLLERPGCFNPQKFKFRNIYSISKLELRCYDSKSVK